MKKTHILLATVAGFAFAAPAIAADKEKYEAKTKIEADSKGNIEKKTSVETTDSAGTSTSVKQDVEIDAKADGTTDKTVKTVATKDPKGLLNKSKVKTEETSKTAADGTVIEHKKTVDGHVEDKTAAPAR